MIPYTVKKISSKIAKEYIHKHHYSHGSHNGPSPCYGLFDKENLIGCLMFATPCSENVRKSLFGEQYKDSVVELHRLHVLDGTPKNTESWFIGQCFKLIKKDRPHTMGIISFADGTEGHKGIIYRATNFLYCGTTGSTTFYRDEKGTLRHPRQNGVNITKKEAVRRGWTAEKRLSKYRYVYLLNRKAKFLFLLESYPYPS